MQISNEGIDSNNRYRMTNELMSADRKPLIRNKQSQQNNDRVRLMAELTV